MASQFQKGDYLGYRECGFIHPGIALSPVVQKLSFSESAAVAAHKSGNPKANTTAKPIAPCHVQYPPNNHAISATKQYNAVPKTAEASTKRKIKSSPNGTHGRAYIFPMGLVFMTV